MSVWPLLSFEVNARLRNHSTPTNIQKYKQPVSNIKQISTIVNPLAWQSLTNQLRRSNRAFCWPRNMSVWPLLSVQVSARLWNHGRWINTQDTNAHMECPSQMDTPLLATLPQHKLANQSKPPNPEAFTNFTSWKNVNLYIHSLGIKTIAVWINTNNSTSPAPSLEIKDV